MKKTLTMIAVALMICATTMAKELKVLEVKDVLRLTAGVKKVEANFSVQQVLVTYDAEKTDAKKIVAALKKNGYEASVVSDGAPSEVRKQVPVDGTSGASKQKK